LFLVQRKKWNTFAANEYVILEAMKERRKIVILLHFVLILFVVQGQDLKALSIVSNEKESDSISIPFSSLYGNTWGGSNTRLRTNLLDVRQKYILPLQTEEENVFVFPCVNKMYVCSSYGMRSGRMHTGMDIKQKLGDSIVAAWGGVVRMAQKNYYAYGNIVVIRHPNGLETLYAHLSDIHVKENQTVKAGELIGRAGRTGRATTEHLHFETRFLYEHFNPKTISDFNTFSLNSDTLFVSDGKFSNKPFSVQDVITTEDIIPLDTIAIADNSSEQENQPIKEMVIEKPKQEIRQDLYIIRKGDTLYSISKQYKVKVNDICQLNNISQDSILQIGQKLRLK
jgi:murein DD-endopeptidase MepM/ murein hydrolase activator NlpD